MKIQIPVVQEATAATRITALLRKSLTRWKEEFAKYDLKVKNHPMGSMPGVYVVDSIIQRGGVNGGLTLKIDEDGVTEVSSSVFPGKKVKYDKIGAAVTKELKFHLSYKAKPPIKQVSEDKQLEVLKKQRVAKIAAHKKDMEELDAEIAKLAKKAGKGGEGKVMTSTPQGPFTIKADGSEVTRKTFDSATNFRPKHGARSGGVMLDGSGKKIMVYGNKTLDGRIMRSPSWHWASKAIRAKYFK